MQTFLPYPDFETTARCLDDRRLGRQRVEALQILNAIVRQNGWRHHPAVKMWTGYEDALRAYMNAMIKEWTRRGYRNSMAIEDVPSEYALPWWLGMPEFHAAHRSNLLRKDPAYYGRFGWTEAEDFPYVWPTRTPTDGRSAASR